MLSQSEVAAEYPLDPQGVIRAPGKFEGDPWWVMSLWMLGLDGGADEDGELDDETPTFVYRPWTWDAASSDNAGDVMLALGEDVRSVITLWEDSNGFVHFSADEPAAEDRQRWPLPKLPTDGELIRSVTFEPYLVGAGPWFRLDLYSGNFGRFSTGQERMGYRLIEIDGDRETVLFSACDYGRAPGNSEDGNATIEGVMGFLCLRPGDTDSEYFKNYTPNQRDFAASHGETLGCEVHARFCDEDGNPLEDRE